MWKLDQHLPTVMIPEDASARPDLVLQSRGTAVYRDHPDGPDQRSSGVTAGRETPQSRSVDWPWWRVAVGFGTLPDSRSREQPNTLANDQDDGLIVVRAAS